MKVILSIDPVRFPLTGIGRYTFELASQLKRMPQIEQLSFLSGHRLVRDCTEPKQAGGISNLMSLSSGLRGAVLKNAMAVEMYRLASSLVKQKALRAYSDHVFHGPNFYLPPFAGPSVCTFHDLSMFTWAHCHPPERVRFMRKEISLSLKRADMLITDSEFTRQEVASYFNWPLEKIRAVPLACSAGFRPRAADELFPVLEKHNLKPAGYCLYAGTIEPRKNLDVLLDAYLLLPQAVRRQWPLVLMGYHGWRSEQLHARIERAESEGWLRYLGFMDEATLPLIYAGARLFVFPSLYEGFGLPVLEAMASGIPVVCSNSSTLPEVAGDAAAMCAPQDVDALSQLIAAGLEDESWRREAALRGLQRAASFSWQRCAEQTAAVYREVIA
ncbi:MAG TPA: glycosyltransferase family 1 protein [Gallionella sp.]|nr:glycosyltransferase family 1 protein [Gallionella sp.]